MVRGRVGITVTIRVAVRVEIRGTKLLMIDHEVGFRPEVGIRVRVRVMVRLGVVYDTLGWVGNCKALGSMRLEGASP